MWVSAAVTTVAASCEQRVAGGLLGNWQPANTVTSLAFVAVGALILARAHGAPTRQAVRARRWFGLVVAAVGVGSVIQHGPYPDWQAYAHDLTLSAVLAFVAADAIGDVCSRRTRVWWWLVPALAVAPFVAAGHAPSTAAQVVLAAVAIAGSLLRAYLRPALRRTVLVALAVLVAGAFIGTMGEQGGWCISDSLWQGHALWHVLAAAALWLLSPAIGVRRPDKSD